MTEKYSMACSGYYALVPSGVLMAPLKRFLLACSSRCVKMDLGLITKIHLVCDRHGWLLAFTLSPGQMKPKGIHQGHLH